MSSCCGRLWFGLLLAHRALLLGRCVFVLLRRPLRVRRGRGRYCVGSGRGSMSGSWATGASGGRRLRTELMGAARSRAPLRFVIGGGVRSCSVLAGHPSGLNQSPGAGASGGRLALADAGFCSRRLHPRRDSGQGDLPGKDRTRPRGDILRCARPGQRRRSRRTPRSKILHRGREVPSGLETHYLYPLSNERPGPVSSLSFLRNLFAHTAPSRASSVTATSYTESDRPNTER